MLFEGPAFGRVVSPRVSGINHRHDNRIIARPHLPWRRLRRHSALALLIVRWATGKRLTNRLPKLSLITLSPPLNRGILGLRMGPYVPTPRFFYSLWGPRESYSSDSWHEEIRFSLKSVFMVDVRFELMCLSTTPFVRALVRWATGKRFKLSLITVSQVGQETQAYSVDFSVRKWDRVGTPGLRWPVDENGPITYRWGNYRPSKAVP